MLLLNKIFLLYLFKVLDFFLITSYNVHHIKNTIKKNVKKEGIRNVRNRKKICIITKHCSDGY